MHNVVDKDIYDSGAEYVLQWLLWTWTISRISLFFIVVELAAGMVVGCKRMKRERKKVDAIDIPITH